MTKKLVTCYVDGSYNKSLKIGGYGICIVWGDKISEYGNGLKTNSGNRMELYALYACLVKLKRVLKENSYYVYDSIEVIVYTDSSYVANSYNRLLTAWKDREYNTIAGEKIKNHDIWKGVIRIANELKINDININVEKIRGHDGNELHDKADKIAKRERKEFENEIYK